MGGGGYNNPNEKSYDNQPITIEDDEDYSTSNFTCSFRKWYKSKPNPTLPEPDFAEFKARKPFLSPGSHAGYHLDYITWAQFGFDGTRKTPLIKRKSDSNENPATKVKLD